MSNIFLLNLQKKYLSHNKTVTKLVTQFVLPTLTKTSNNIHN